MLYRRESTYRDDSIGDADELMMELFNASAALKGLDQNNFLDNSIPPDRAIPSSVGDDITRSLTVGQKNGVLLSQVVSGIDVTSPAGSYVSSTTALDLALVGVLRMRLYAYGQHFNSAGNVSRLDVRFLINGEPGACLFTHNMFRPAGNARLGWSLSEEVLLEPGRHAIRVQARDRSDTVGEVRGAYVGTAGQATIMAIGFRP